MSGAELRAHFDGLAPARTRWRRWARGYHAELERFVRFLVPPEATVLEIGCGTGDLLATVAAPGKGIGVDFSHAMIRIARDRHPRHRFVVGDAERLPVSGPFDYVVLSDLVGQLEDVQSGLMELRHVVVRRSRLIVTYYNYLWEPALRAAERLGLKMPQPVQHWLPRQDIDNILRLSGFDVVRTANLMLLPVAVPGVAPFANRILARLPGLQRLALMQVVIARPAPRPLGRERLSVSVVIPCRNERGNVAAAVERTPAMGRHTELIFVEGHSTDGTAQAIEAVIRDHPERAIRLVSQGAATGKGDAVRQGFARATGDVVMILDGDLTVRPEDLPRFLDALAAGHGELINGSRLVYQRSQQAMRVLNLLGNKVFSWLFGFLLDQRFRDTLCGTKALLRSDYLRIAANRAYFGDFDPFGDFDLLFGAARLNLKIAELPVRYLERSYGATSIRRFRHGWLLLRMCLVAMRRLKFV
jgi:SAM-dependent methyltransferase